MSTKKYSFLIEVSPTHIYQRISKAFVETLVQLGHRVHFVNPWQYPSEQDYLNAIISLDLDYYLINNCASRILIYLKQQESFLYEILDKPLIFIHHDSLFHYFLLSPHIVDKEEMVLRIKKFILRKDKDFHFCLEYYNYLDLKALGFERCYHIYHSSEFQRDLEIKLDQRDISFVGHVVYGREDSLKDIPFFHWFHSDFWNRIFKLDYLIENSANSFAEFRSKSKENTLNYLADKYFYLAILHQYSCGLRGEIIKAIENFNVEIIGGDTGYLNELSFDRKIQKPNIKYYPPLTDYSKVKEVYASSKINLNITSLQFDTAVINRVIDVGAVGGFILTDYKADLVKLTSVWEEISYKSIEELNDKIAYYLQPEHAKERKEIAATFHQEIKEKCSYINVVQEILEKLSREAMEMENLNIDLGCGRRKPKGFIGVDVYSAPEIDVVADLNKRFPFPDNCAELIRAYDVIEHLENRIHTMNEIWRIAKPGALVDLLVPSTDGRGAFQDPTHISFWNINSFKYYCVEHPSYLELNQIYGFKGAFSIVSLEDHTSPDQVIHVRAVLKVVKNSNNDTQSLLPKIKLKQFNLVVFPDWEQPEEILAAEIRDLLEWVLAFQEKERLTLLIDIQHLEEDEVSLFIFSILMELLDTEKIDETDLGVEINFIDNLTQQQWQILCHRLSGQFVLEHQKLPESYLAFAENIPQIAP